MKTRPKLKGIAVALSAVGLLGVTDAIAGKFVCNTTMTLGTIDANIEVPEGALCILNRTTVNGNIDVKPGGECILNGVTVNGNIDVKSNNANGGGELYFGVFDGGEGHPHGQFCYGTSNVSGNISVKGTKDNFAGFGVGSSTGHCEATFQFPVGIPAILNLGTNDDRANLAIDHAVVYQGNPNGAYQDMINVRGNVSVKNSDRDGLGPDHRIWAINVINTTGPNGKIHDSDMDCKDNTEPDGLFVNHSVGGDLKGDGSCFPP